MADKQCFTWRKEVDDTRGYKKHLLWTQFLCFKIVSIWISVSCASKPFVQSSFSESLKLLHTCRLIVTRALLGFFFFQLTDNLKVVVLFPSNAENVGHLWFYLLL